MGRAATREFEEDQFEMIGGVLLDISGVLYQGDVAIPGAVEAVRRLRDTGLPIRFLTNSTVPAP
ncbi:hypothetical protein [Aliiruegeria lutimaris]|uniref:Haloacid dehalogenase-like hydrolase n=1 Tax=Aliiruegeria lutimaris TaxID=571298 RepID=A0A1G8X0M0_9RHOB|nr:hypothetical protein [Aliiruegeria lutimaris]SDJ83405.1 Haloacid dehalogenase-like hydrolase [Aliiruegeria lutimaris]